MQKRENGDSSGFIIYKSYNRRRIIFCIYSILFDIIDSFIKPICVACDLIKFHGAENEKRGEIAVKSFIFTGSYS